MGFVLFMYPQVARRQVELPPDFQIKQIAHFILMIAAYYTNAYYLIPRVLFRNRKWLFFASVILFAMVANFTMASVHNWLDLTPKLDAALGKKSWTSPYVDIFGLLTTIFVLGISTSIAVIQKWERDNSARLDLEKQNIVAELSFLKAQIHPHFFFNTLHSIYALTYSDVGTSRKVIHKLSRMMRYLLYETHQNKVPLSKELSFIRDYIEVMKLRTKENTQIEYTIPELHDDPLIAPMLLLPYVENAFKHGVDDVKTSTIIVSIDCDSSALELKIRNMVVKSRWEELTSIAHSGIGMTNTRRRLDMLYKDNYSLQFGEDVQTGEYNLHLSINLE